MFEDMPNFMENSRTKFEKFMEISLALSTLISRCYIMVN